ncbi:MAG: hypothetical protein E4G98_05580 [Promethearchaeota archaeon]|nr:MAG: hypothetical protein E4G98_05580 [Candidatus Lokiarchaeota archaeon]
MSSTSIFFNPFYQLLLVVFFSGLRIIRQILRSFILPTETKTDEQSQNIATHKNSHAKTTGYWSAYYIMFAICTIYNSILLLTQPAYLTQSLHFFWVALTITLLAGLRYFLIAFFERPSRFSRYYHLTVILYEFLALLVIIPTQTSYWSVLWIFLPMLLWPITLISTNSTTFLILSSCKRFLSLGSVYVDVIFWFLALTEVILQYFGFSLGFW